MNSLNVVFGGTPEFAVPALAALHARGYRIKAVYTQPDRPSGRGQQLHASPVKEFALRHGLHVEQPQSLRTPEAAAQLASFRPDVMIVVAYGLILPQAILDVPPLGCVNIHGSLLPRWRGAAPINRAILAGDIETGISIMRMNAGLDTGPVLSMHPVQIGARDSAAQLHDRLAELGAEALVATLPKYASGELLPRPQAESGVTYAHKIKKEEALIDWRQSTRQIDAQVRAFNPWPIAETRLQGQQLRVWQASPHDAEAYAHNSPTGAIIGANAKGIVAVAGDGLLVIERLQLAGRKVLSAAEFINAHSVVGERLG